MKFNSIILINIILLFIIWGYGSYCLIEKNDEIMIILMPFFTYWVFRKNRKKS